MSMSGRAIANSVIAAYIPGDLHVVGSKRHHEVSAGMERPEIESGGDTLVLLAQDRDLLFVRGECSRRVVGRPVVTDNDFLSCRVCASRDSTASPTK